MHFELPEQSSFKDFKNESILQLAYLADLFSHFDDVNISLKGLDKKTVQTQV
jgi:hypothetical protein